MNTFRIGREITAFVFRSSHRTVSKHTNMFYMLMADLEVRTRFDGSSQGKRYLMRLSLFAFASFANGPAVGVQAR
jgi:hypothetical protein